jgi:hypothetical protein
MAPMPGYLSYTAHTKIAEPFGRLVLTGADIAVRWNSWIDGAIGR